MSNKSASPQIYLSYSWKNSAIAYSIEEDFNAIGIRLIRDIRNLSFSKPFKEFAASIGKKDYVWLIISEESFLCETSLLEMLDTIKENLFKKQFLLINVIAFEDSDKQFKLEKIKAFWKEKLIDAEVKCSVDLSSANIDLFIKYQTIINEIDQLIIKLYEPPYIDIETLKNGHYETLFMNMEWEDKNLIIQALAIAAIKNIKVKELELVKYLFLYPNNRYGLFINALLEIANGVFWKAKNFFQQLVALNKYDLLANLHLVNILFMITLSKQEKYY